MTRSRLVPILLAAVLLVGAANLGAYAATGSPLLIGKGNESPKTTTLATTGHGAVLSLKGDPKKASLKVNGTGVVKKLNADQLDGKDSKALQTTSYSYRLSAPVPIVNSVQWTFPGVPAGRYLVSYNISADGGGGTAFACYFYPGVAAGQVSTVVAVGDLLGATWHATSSGEIDMGDPRGYVLVCQANGGAGITVPASNTLDAQIVFTKIDNLTTGTRAGVPVP